MNYRKHYHVCWWDLQQDPEPHVLCLTAYNEAEAVQHTDEYLGESLGHIEAVAEKETDYLHCTAKEY